MLRAPGGQSTRFPSGCSGAFCVWGGRKKGRQLPQSPLQELNVRRTCTFLGSENLGRSYRSEQRVGHIGERKNALGRKPTYSCQVQRGQPVKGPQ